jgi:CheY-like chemotaxis protein
MDQLQSATKILVVDDNETNRYVLSKILTGRGAEVVQASTGGEAITAVKQQPDLILMDIHLPDMTGYAALEKLRATPDGVDVAVILMSAVEPPPHARNAAAALGVRSFLTLPVVPDDLWIVIQATMHRRRRQAG